MCQDHVLLPSPKVLPEHAYLKGHVAPPGHLKAADAWASVPQSHNGLQREGQVLQRDILQTLKGRSKEH